MWLKEGGLPGPEATPQSGTSIFMTEAALVAYGQIPQGLLSRISLVAINLPNKYHRRHKGLFKKHITHPRRGEGGGSCGCEKGVRQGTGSDPFVRFFLLKIIKNMTQIWL